MNGRSRPWNQAEWYKKHIEGFPFKAVILKNGKLYSGIGADTQAELDSIKLIIMGDNHEPQRLRKKGS